MSAAARRYLERKVAESCVADLLAAGWLVTVNDGEEDTLVDSRSPAAVLEAMFATDEDVLYVRAVPANGYEGWVRFVYGNDGWDVINDYTTNLETTLAKTNTLADELSS